MFYTSVVPSQLWALRKWIVFLSSGQTAFDTRQKELQWKGKYFLCSYNHKNYLFSDLKTQTCCASKITQACPLLELSCLCLLRSNSKLTESFQNRWTYKTGTRSVRQLALAGMNSKNTICQAERYLCHCSWIYLFLEWKLIGSYANIYATTKKQK